VWFSVFVQYYVCVATLILHVACIYFIFIFNTYIIPSLWCILLVANNVMEGVKRRLPQIDLRPSESERDLLKSVRDWRNVIQNSRPGFSLETVRIDSCINGYGMYEYSVL